MIAPKSHLALFSRYLWLALTLFGVAAASFIAYVFAEKNIDAAYEMRLRSFLLADELRHSSDDLTRMVRTYAVTGDPRFKQRYLEILAIRDGRQPRPVNYQNSYWDLVLADDRRPGPSGSAIALLDLMKQAGFTADELALLIAAKAASDALTRTEFAAMALIEAPALLPENRDKAIRLLHDDDYRRARAAIMGPISAAQYAADQRTLATVHSAKMQALLLRSVFLSLGFLFVALLWNVRRNLRATLGGTMKELHGRITRLGGGDFSERIPVAAGMENSVLGWLSETQINLAHIDAQRRDAEARNQRLNQLYAALSHCNKAIVRCTGESELFDQICRVIVIHGGLNMAWIGRVDHGGNQIKPIAWHGQHTDYLSELHITLSADHPSGRGPTARAFREDQPFWCQDFQHDPATQPWHEQGARSGWGASAALPLHRDGKVVLMFCLYAHEPNAFDEQVRDLLLEMAVDIDYALKGFDLARQREQVETALRQSEQHLRTIIETEPECIKVVDAEGRLLQINAAGLAMLEADSLDEAQRHDLLEFIGPTYRDAFVALHQGVLNGESGTLEFELTGLKGTQRWLETRAAPMRGGSDNKPMLLGITRDITDRKRAEEQIRHLAHYDALTGLPNRTQLNDRARYALSLAQRNQSSVALMFLDLDHFKDINDTLGHTTGDALLIDIARRLRHALRDEDTVSRLGGDEFIILLYGLDAHGVAHVAQKLLDTIAEPYRIDPYDLNVTASIGISMYPHDGADLETLQKNADTAMYRTKHEGRYGYSFFTAEMQARSARQLQLVNALRSAVERNQLQVHYQPQVSMRGGHIVGVEALLRWTHPELGSVSPAEFIPAAEDSGLILPIGEWVLRHAVRQVKHWMQDGLAPLVMAVNLSAVQFRHPDLPSLITRILDEEGLPPEYLELELTEGVAMNDPQRAIAVMNDLHERGVRMSIDDFGTGYSSLSHLKKFRVYKLKIDQSFVRDISTDAEDKAIVGAIIKMAKSLGLQTIAEGVETEGQLAFLREEHCDEMQGYLCSQPLPAEQFKAFALARSSALKY